MIGYPYIIELFTNVLEKSKQIQGRLFVAPRYGQEINSDRLETVLQETIKDVDAKKYPLALLFPPRTKGDFRVKTDSWRDVHIVLFFLQTTYYNGNNQIKTPNRGTQTSMHTVPQDWHDMDRCATNFIYVLNQIQRSKNLINTAFRLTSDKAVISPVSFVGVDRTSGVRLDFDCQIFGGCDVEDYTDEDINSIIVPTGDSHPEHNN